MGQTAAIANGTRASETCGRRGETAHEGDRLRRPEEASGKLLLGVYPSTVENQVAGGRTLGCNMY